MKPIDTLHARDPDAAAARPPSQRLGSLLREAGLLTPDKTERIAQAQQRDGSLFGQLAMRLYGLTERDLEQALRRQFGHYTLAPGHAAVSGEVVAAYDPHAAALAPLRKLRSHLLAEQALRKDHATYAVTSAGRGDGRSVLCANLAVLFAQLGKRTLLIDADLHHPRQHLLFGLAPWRGLASALAGLGGDHLLQSVTGLPALSVLVAGARTPNPHELLARPALAQLLRRCAQQFEVIVIDTPANAASGDAQAIAMGARQALLLARRDATAAAATATLIEELETAGVRLVGSVLNDFPGARA